MIQNLKNYLFYHSYTYSYRPKIYIAYVGILYALTMPVAYYVNYQPKIFQMFLACVFALAILFWQTGELNTARKKRSDKIDFVNTFNDSLLAVDWDSVATAHAEHLSPLDLKDLETEKEIYARMLKELTHDPKEFLSKFSELRVMRKLVDLY